MGKNAGSLEACRNGQELELYIICTYTQLLQNRLSIHRHRLALIVLAGTLAGMPFLPKSNWK